MLDTGPDYTPTRAANGSGGQVFVNAAFDPAYDPRTDPEHPLYRGK